MILEIAEISVRAGEEEAFEHGVAEAKPHFLAAPGCHGLRLHRGIEDPSRYWLFVEWESVEAHMEDFRASSGFAEWRRLVGGSFAEPPRVRHVRSVAGI